jgi:hypothetical protein
MGYDLKALLVKKIVSRDLCAQGQGSKVQVNRLWLIAERLGSREAGNPEKIRSDEADNSSYHDAFEPSSLPAFQLSSILTSDYELSAVSCELLT